MAKTVREFKVTGDVWTLVDEWAKGQFFFNRDIPVFSKEEPNTRTYKAGGGASLMDVFIKIIQVEDMVRLEGWKTPGEQPIESFSVFGAVNPNNLTAKSSFNKLLEKFGQPSLDESKLSSENSGSAMREYVNNQQKQKDEKIVLQKLIIKKFLPWFLWGLGIIILLNIITMIAMSADNQIIGALSCIFQFVCLGAWVVGAIKARKEAVKELSAKE